NKVQCVGDVMYDAALYYGQRAQACSNILKQLSLQPKAYTLATIHRAENTDDPKRLEAILSGFSAFAKKIVLPLHPRTCKRLESCELKLPPNVQLIDPIGYLDMVMLEQNANLIATDSGGVQKEAFFHRIPCVTLRDETEWTELIEAGWNRLAPPVNSEEIAATMMSAIKSKGNNIQPYGAGNAGSLIASSLIEYFEL
ncbi:MAG: UDP-N-acetylglucosamine 2-epimerase, partial [Endozoicomonas sp. (ex Botrylloides leachii)]|nr:UDP-N-acetylglucosamine 2-epimerase [Endozoicomonas sp. (ex Botrylloides leachii)]